MRKALSDLPAPDFCPVPDSPEFPTESPHGDAPGVILDESLDENDEQESNAPKGIVAGIAAGALLWGVLVIAIGIAS